MKKKIMLFGTIGLLVGCGIVFTVNQPKVLVKAEEEPTVATVVEGEEPTEEEMKSEIEEYLSRFLERQWVQNIIVWASEGGLISALFVVYLKYHKYKATNVEDLTKLIKKEVGKYLTENFADLSKNEIKKIIGSFECVEGKMDVLMQALVLAQDKTAEGKIALLKLIQENADNKKVNETIEKVEEKVIAEQKKEEEIKDKVSGEYNPID